MKNSKKLLAGITAFAFMLAVASCSDSKNNGESGAENGNGNGNNSSASNENTPISAQESMKNAYKAIELGDTVPLTYVADISPIGDTGKILMTGYTEGYDIEDYGMFITDYEFINFEKIDFSMEKPENGEASCDVMVGRDGNIYIFSTRTVYGEEMPDWDDEDFDYENFDWDAFYDSAEYEYKLYTLDVEGNILSENEITGIEKYQNDSGQVYIGSRFVCGDNLLFTISSPDRDETLVKVNKDGEIEGEIDLNGNEVYEIYTNVTDEAGNLYYSTWNDEGKTVVKKIDAETLEVSEYFKLDSQEVSYINRFFLASNSDEFEFYVSDTSSLYGLRSDGTTEEVINWLDSDMNGDYVQEVFPVENGEFIVYERNWNNEGSDSTKFYRLTKRDASELENVQIINMVVEYDDSRLMSKVNDFNKASDKYRIKVHDYGNYFEWDSEKEEYLNSPSNQLKLDIAAGKTFDIIAINTSGNSLISTLGKKGALVDLYEYMGKDGSVKKEDILPNILEAGEYDGKLYSLTPTFSVSTMAVKAKYCDKENWTMKDLIETYKNAPDGMKLFQYSTPRSSILNSFLTYSDDYIDYVNAKCYFDSQDFVDLLEFCNSLEDFEEIDWDSMSDDEMNDYWNEQETAILNDKALMDNMYISEPRAYVREKYGTFGGEDISLVGYPSSDGRGAKLETGIGYAIMASSANKDAAWEFISQFFDEKYQNDENNMYSFPVLESAFQKRLDKGMEKPYYIDSDGEKHEYEDSYWINGESISLPLMTKEERDYLEKYIRSAKAVTNDYYSNLTTIINEEAEAYFNGERSAQEAADIIQNRLSILVSEQY